MGKEQLLQQIADLRRNMFDKEILGEYFLNLELIEESQPNFVEDLIGTYFSSSGAFMDELQHLLKSNSHELREVEVLIITLKGGCACMGATRLHAAVEEMLNIFRGKKLDRLQAAFDRVKDEHPLLRAHLEPYAKLLQQMRVEEPPDEESDNQDEIESVSSNEIDG